MENGAFVEVNNVNVINVNDFKESKQCIYYSLLALETLILNYHNPPNYIVYIIYKK